MPKKLIKKNNVSIVNYNIILIVFLNIVSTIIMKLYTHITCCTPMWPIYNIFIQGYLYKNKIVLFCSIGLCRPTKILVLGHKYDIEVLIRARLHHEKLKLGDCLFYTHDNIITRFIYPEVLLSVKCIIMALW